jgi:hypothetical protein
MNHSFDFETPSDLYVVLNDFRSNGILGKDDIELNEILKSLHNDEYILSNTLKDLKARHWNPSYLHLRDNMSVSKLRRHDEDFHKNENILIKKLRDSYLKRSHIYQMQDFQELFTTRVKNFSLVKTSISGDELEVLLVPPAISKNLQCSVQLLSTDTPIGKKILNKSIGYIGDYIDPIGRTHTLTVLTTQVCPMEVLLSFQFAKRDGFLPSAVLPPGNGGERRSQQLRPW